MKLLVLFSALHFFSFSQTDTIRVNKTLNYYPSISGVQDGNIEYWKLCNAQGLQTKADCSIMSFDLQYWGSKGLTSQHFSGNQIPDSICTQIALYGLQNMIFFTNIKAIDPQTGRVLHLSPMNLIPVAKNE